MHKHRFDWIAVGISALLLSAAVEAGSTKVRIDVRDADGAVVSDVLLVFQNLQDAADPLSIDQNDAGRYEATARFDGDEASFSVVKVLAPGLLPLKLDLTSTSGSGEALQEIRGMDLDPGNPIPPIRMVASGRVEMDLVLGEQALVMERFRAARKAAREEAQAAQQAPAASAAYARAVELYNAGDFDGAVTAFEEALAERPDDAQLEAAYAGALFKAKRHAAFEAVAQKSLARNPSNPNLLMMVYSSTRSRGDMPAALDALLAVRKLGGGNDLLPHLAFVAKKLGNTEAAVPAHEAILDLDANRRDSLVALASIHERAGRGARAQGYVDRAVALDASGAYGLYLALATALLDKPGDDEADLDRAIVHLDKAVGLQPDSVEALHALGLARRKRGDHAAAATALRKYLTLKPDAEDRAMIADYLNSLPG